MWQRVDDLVGDDAVDHVLVELGEADIPAFSIEEVLSTKIRALLQRSKGRDLVDLAHALEVFPDLNAQRTVDMFIEYVKQKPIPRWESEKRMFEKLEDGAFLADVRPLLAVEEAEKFDDEAGRAAFSTVYSTFITRIPGEAWAQSGDIAERLGLPDLAKQ